jgi:putative ABC transport system permease protein
MLRNYLKTAWRNISRNKLLSMLNIAGLATGMAVALLIGLWVFYQYSYDRFFPAYDRAYQVKNNHSISSGEIYTQDVLPIPLAKAMKKDVPGIECVAVTFSVTYGPMSDVLSVGEKKLSPAAIAVGDDFLKIFKFPLLEGAADYVFSEPGSIVLTESTAKALFGREDPLGKTVLMNNYANLKVTAVLKDLPANSSLQFGFLTSFTDMAKDGWVHEGVTDWNQPAFKIYVSLKPHVSYDQVEPRISGLFKKYAPGIYQKSKQQVIMQPVKDWHLYSEYENGVPVGGLIEYVGIFIILGVLVLLIACINFMNLSTARFEKRAKEVGIRKVVGSSKAWLVMQFLTESVMVAMAAFIISLVFVESALPAFNSLAGTAISIPFANPQFWLLMIGYILFTGCLAGSRPAFYLSSFQPVKVLKGKLQVGKFAALPRKILVVLQFSCSIALITGTIVIYQQIQYTKNRPRGYDANRLIVTEGAGSGDYTGLKQAALQSGLVTSMTASLSPPTEVYTHWDIEGWTNKKGNGSLKVALTAIGDSDYFKTLGITFKEGRNFAGDRGKDSLCAIFNEAAIEQMQLKQPLSSDISSFSNPTLPHRLRIIGVVHDALTNGPFAKAEPAIYVYQPWLFVITYRLSPNVDVHVAMDRLRTIFTRYRPQYPFQYHFVDESFTAKFALESLVGKLAGIFAILAIFISCLGLFGLAAFVAEQRNKEIGIRKVLGASVRSVFILVTKDFIQLVVISSFVASLAAYYFLQNWLQGYYYHTSISPVVFLISAAGAIVIAVATISFQAIKAAVMTPVKSLRTE